MKKQGDNQRAGYGDGLIKELSAQMTRDFGAGYTPRNLWYMKQMYTIFPKVNTLCAQLSWSHYRLLISLDDEKAKIFI